MMELNDERNETMIHNESSAHDNTASGFDLQLFAELAVDGTVVPGVTPAAESDSAAAIPTDAVPAPTDKPAAAPKSLLGENTADDKAADVATPDAYEDFKLPEGFDWDDKVGGSFKEMAKEMGLSQDNAQKLVDLGAQMMGGQSTALQDASTAQAEEWYNESTSKFKDADIQVANKALETFGTPELTAMLKATGLSNNPEVIGMFNRIGAATSEGKMIDSNTAAAQSRLYANSPSMYNK